MGKREKRETVNSVPSRAGKGEKASLPGKREMTEGGEFG